jgi:hypothetical protein
MNKETKKFNIEIPKPKMPLNFSICTINNIDYIQFCKKIDNIKHQYKTKINSYNLQLELNNFIEYLNKNYKLNLEEQKVSKTKWKTTNILQQIVI